MNTNMSSQDKILLKIKTFGPQTARMLSKQLNMTTMGTRQHLAILEEKGLVSQTAPEKRKRGRPVRHWQLTRKGHEQFPDGHRQIVTTLLSSVRDVFGDDGLEKVIRKRGRSLHRTYGKAIADCGSLVAKVETLAKIRSEAGYMCDFLHNEDDSILLVENHCPIFDAATESVSFCKSELDTFRKLLAEDASVMRTEHIIAGERRCAYLITPKG